MLTEYCPVGRAGALSRTLEFLEETSHGRCTYVCVLCCKKQAGMDSCLMTRRGGTNDTTTKQDVGVTVGCRMPPISANNT